MTLTHPLEGINNINIPLWQLAWWTSWTSNGRHQRHAFTIILSPTDLIPQRIWFIQHLSECSHCILYMQTLKLHFSIVSKSLNDSWNDAFPAMWLSYCGCHDDVITTSQLAWNFWQSFLIIMIVCRLFYDAYSFFTCIFKWCLCCFEHIYNR